MTATEILTIGSAKKFLLDELSKPDVWGETFISLLDEKIVEWSKEFDSLEREIKRHDVNNFKINRILELYFLVPASLSIMEQLKKEQEKFYDQA